MKHCTIIKKVGKNCTLTEGLRNDKPLFELVIFVNVSIIASLHAERVYLFLIWSFVS